MRFSLFLLLVSGFALAADAPKKDDAVKQDLDKLRGNWSAVSYAADGKQASPDELKKIKLTLAGDHATLTHGAQTKHAVYKLDPTQKPKALDVVAGPGPEKKKPDLHAVSPLPLGLSPLSALAVLLSRKPGEGVLHGIYELEGDSLKICLAQPGQERPKEFAAKPGTVLKVFKREVPVAAKPAAPPPVFADKNLEAAVRATLQEVKGELNDSNLVNVYVLEASGKNISSLQGLEKCKNLALLKLTGNQVTDVTPLKGLTNLQSLDLANNKVADVGPLAGLTKLQYLELSNNQVSNVAPLQGLSALSALYLSNNKVSDIGPLGNLAKLSSLSLNHNQVRDISALAKVTKLATLDLNDNQIEDLTPLTKQTELSLLMLERNKISNLGPLVAMVKADAEGPKRFAPYLRLYLKGNPLPLAELKGYGVRLDY